MSDSKLQFVTLLTSHQGRLFAYVLSLVGDADQARDVMQETNAVLWQKSEQFELGTNFSAWMFRTALFQVMAHRKRISRDRLVFDDALVGDLAKAAEHRSEHVQLRQDLLRECLARLPHRQRDLIQARYEDGFDLATIAQSFSRTTAAVKQTLFRARKNLVDCVAKKFEGRTL